MHRNSFVALGPISMKSQSDRSFWDDAKQDIKKLFDHFSRLQDRYFLSVRAEGGLGKEELVPANEGKRKYGHKQIKFNIFFSSSSFYLLWDLVFLTYGGHESIKCLFIVWIDIKKPFDHTFLGFSWMFFNWIWHVSFNSTYVKSCPFKRALGGEI